MKPVWKSNTYYMFSFFVFAILFIAFPSVRNYAIWLPVIFFGLAVAVSAVVLRRRLRLSKLKKTGMVYKATVFEIVRPLFSKSGWSGSVLVQYVNENGERCTLEVKGLIILAGDREDQMRAKIYMDQKQPKRYEVEVYSLR